MNETPGFKHPNTQLYQLTPHRDFRGTLVAGEFGPQLPFVPKRYFVLFDIPASEERGNHAHYVCEQFLTCVHGNCSVTVDDGKQRIKYELKSPSEGLYVPPMSWVVLENFTTGSALVVFASDHYDKSDYITDYAEFVRKATQA